MIQYFVAAAAAYLAGDYITKDLTGRHIHEHVFVWWCKLRDYVNQWLHQNRQLPICAIGLVVLDAFDDVMVNTKRTADKITLGLFGMDRQEREYGIVTQEVSMEEAYQQFPQLRQTHLLMQELSH